MTDRTGGRAHTDRSPARSELRNASVQQEALVNAPLGSGDPVTQLQRTAGNQAVAGMFEAHRVTGRSAPLVTIVAQRAPGAGSRPASASSATQADLSAAEAWLFFIALRGNAPAPSVAVPPSYRGTLASVQSAAGGPGPIPARELVVDDLAFGEARVLLRRLRADHDRLTPRAGYDVFDLAEVAIERGQANFRGGGSSFEGGATQLDQAQILIGIVSAAGDEIKAAGEAGYAIPMPLAVLPSEAQAQLDAALAGWDRRSPSQTKRTTPTDEIDLIDFSDHALKTINGVRRRRVADMARARRREADLIASAAERQLIQLQALLAEKRRAAFMAGEEGTLRKIHAAIGQVVSAIDETKAAASLITDQVDRLNAVTKLASKEGTALINVPSMPRGISEAAGRLASANEKLGKVIELLDLVGPAKTELDVGLKYLKAADMALEHFGGTKTNPFLSVYINSYLSPGIKNCMRSIGTIAGIMSRQNRAIIGSGDPRVMAGVEWEVEPGGAAAYIFLARIFKVGAAASISDAAWGYFSDHRGDLAAAVGKAMPSERRAVSAWASRHRLALWQSFYGGTQPPR